MAEIGSSVDVASFERDGFLGPFRTLDVERMAHIQEQFLSQFPERSGQGTINCHFDVPAILDLCRQANFLDYMQKILGAAGLVLWRTSVFSGNPKLPWHEDHHANLLEGADISLSCLVAITDGDAGNCTLLVPGSHKLSVREKEARLAITAQRKEGGNIRYKGFLSPTEFVRVPLLSGQCIIFHPALLHASSGFVDCAANADRLNVVFRVTTTSVEIQPRAFEGSPPNATRPILVRGSQSTSAEEANISPAAEASWAL